MLPPPSSPSAHTYVSSSLWPLDEGETFKFGYRRLCQECRHYVSRTLVPIQDALRNSREKETLPGSRTLNRVFKKNFIFYFFWKVSRTTKSWVVVKVWSHDQWPGRAKVIGFMTNRFGEELVARTLRMGPQYLCLVWMLSKISPQWAFSVIRDQNRPHCGCHSAPFPATPGNAQWTHEPCSIHGDWGGAYLWP